MNECVDSEVLVVASASATEEDNFGEWFLGTCIFVARLITFENQFACGSRLPPGSLACQPCTKRSRRPLPYDRPVAPLLR